MHWLLISDFILDYLGGCVGISNTFFLYDVILYTRDGSTILLYYIWALV